MARKVSGVTQRNGRWTATAYDPKKQAKVRVKGPDGKTTFSTQADAIAAKESFEQQKVLPRKRRWKADEFAGQWVDSYPRPEASTNLHNRERIKKFTQDFHGRWLDEITRQEARVWAMANPQWEAARAMFNDALNDGIVDNNPFLNLRIPKSTGRKDHTILTEPEIRLLIQVAGEKYEGWPVMAAMIEVAAYSGMRVGELFALRWEDINFRDGTITVGRQYRSKTKEIALPKSKKERTIALLEPAAQAFRLLDPSEAPDGLVFYTTRGKPMAQRHLHYYWSPVRAAFHARLPKDRAAKIDQNFDFHFLRHFTGSWLADHGASAQDIAHQLGHRDGGRLAQALYIHTYEDHAVKRLHGIGRKAREQAV